MIRPGMFLVDRYEILEKIGSGGMADVYKARDHRLNRLVAIKVLKIEYSTDATFVKKFRVEAQSAGGLSHTNIVNIYDVGESKGIHFIVMELVQGITLKNYIDMKGKLDIREALNISVQIASGISAAHDNRIIHRDIKPQNIIISRDGKVKVTDFGIAKMADSTTVTTTAAGTVYYISPEQARGGYSDEKSDIYSLGITMYEMVTGQVPFDGETNVAVALMHIQNEITPPRQIEPSIPVSLEKIILKCTQKKPDRRYSSVKALIADLRKALSHPDGAYVVLAGAVPVGGTIVMDDSDVDALKGASLRKASIRNAEDSKESQNKKAAALGAASVAAGAVKTSKSADEDDDDDDDEMSPALGKVMMILGIIGFIILAIIIFYIVANALGLFGGLSKNQETESETVIESVTESETETETEELIEVPDLLGMTKAEIRLLLNQIGLTSFTFEEGTSEDYESGQAYEQSPESGEMVGSDTEIIIYISTGKEKFELEDVTGLKYSQAKQLLENDNLDIELKYEYSSTVAEDYVISTSPAAGSQVSEGDTITVYVSKGEEITYVTVPDLLNCDLATAKSKLSALGLTFGGYSESYSDTYDSGKVMEQSVASGKSVATGTSVSVTLSLGPETKTYSVTVSIPDPFETDVYIDEDNIEVYTEGQVKLVIVQDGVSYTVYNEYVTASTIAGSVTWETTSTSTATATLYINGNKFEDSWTVKVQ